MNIHGLYGEKEPSVLDVSGRSGVFAREGLFDTRLVIQDDVTPQSNKLQGQEALNGGLAPCLATQRLNRDMMAVSMLLIKPPAYDQFPVPLPGKIYSRQVAESIFAIPCIIHYSNFSTEVETGERENQMDFFKKRGMKKGVKRVGYNGNKIS